MEYRSRRSNAQDKFQNEYKDLFGEAPETIGYESSSIATESVYGLDPILFQDSDQIDCQNSPAKRLINDELDFDAIGDEFGPADESNFNDNDNLAEGFSNLDSTKKQKKKRQPDKL